VGGFSGRRSTAVAVRGAVLKSLVLACALFCSVLVGSARAAATASKPRVNGVGAPIHWTECEPLGQGVQCARIKVPLDWDHPSGRTISLALIRHLASKPSERIGTAFINPGGPGDTGLGLVRGDPAGIDSFGDGRFDVVSWDPRGTNASTRVRCFRSRRAEQQFWAGATIPITAAASRRFARKDAALAKRCGEVSGWLLPHISTADTARDLDHLRALMGEKEMTYVGLSYGTYLGQTYANMFPSRVRAMLLEGVVDAPRYAKSAEARLAAFTAPSDEVFREFLANCDRAGPKRCVLAGGGETAAERVKRLVARLKRGPIPAPGTTPPELRSESLGYTEFLLSQFQPMRSPVTWPQDANAISAALRGDGSALESSAKPFLSPIGWAPGVTSAAIQCADAPAHLSLRTWPQEVKRLKQISWLQGLMQAWWLWAPCAAWPVHGQDNYRGPWDAKTRNPILLINQRYDPNTGYANAVRAEHYLGKAVLLTLNGYGHLPFQDPSACVESAEHEYLVNLVLPPKGAECNADRKPFDLKFGAPLDLEFGQTQP
jgi:pimeloyl-ACP methyl ester carboxylesterase